MQIAKKTVILDTDIGTDIDDSWALALLLRSPGLDLKLVTVVTGDVHYRAAMVRRLLYAVGRNDITVAVGLSTGTYSSLLELERPAAPAEGYPDAVTAMVEVIHTSREPVTLVAIAPFTNLAAFLKAAPELAAKVDLIAMAGSIEQGLTTGSEPIAEWNVKCDIPSAQAVFAASWRSFTLVPIDSCALVSLPGNWMKILRYAPTALARELGTQYLAWMRYWGYDETTNCIAGQPPVTQTSSLFDTVAVHLAGSDDFLKLRPMRLRVDDRGFCRKEESGNLLRVAIGWQDRTAFETHLAQKIMEA